MPVNYAFFTTKQPRISDFNSQKSQPPQITGSGLAPYPVFKMKYNNNFSCFLNVNGKSLDTLVNSDPDHPHNLSISLLNKSINQLIAEIPSPNYSIEILSPNDLNKKTYFSFLNYASIQNTFQEILFKDLKEYTVEVYQQGDIGASKIIKNDKSVFFSAEYSKWVLEKGNTKEILPIDVDIGGIAHFTDLNLDLNFYKSIYDDSPDLNIETEYKSLNLVTNLDIPTPRLSFSAGALLKQDSLTLYLNDVPQIENRDYIVIVGDTLEIVASTPAPYLITPSNNILNLKINENSFSITLASNIKDAISQINELSLPFIAYLKVKENKEYFTLKSKKGTALYQIIVQDGSCNTLFGWQNNQAEIGSGVSSLAFLQTIDNEIHTASESQTTFIIKELQNMPEGNSFIGLYLPNLIVLEENNLLQKDYEYIGTENGSIDLIGKIEDEDVYSAMWSLDSDLYNTNFSVYENYTELSKDTYKINTETGWLYFYNPTDKSKVYTVSYISKEKGNIEHEVLVGDPASLLFMNRGPYYLTSEDILKIEVNNILQEIIFDENSYSENNLLDYLNERLVDCWVYKNQQGQLTLSTKKVGINYSLKAISNNTSEILGLTNEKVMGAPGNLNNQAFTLKSAPLKINSVYLPRNSNTLLIKNRDASALYVEDSFIRLNKDIYKVKETSLYNRAQAISSISEPYTIFAGVNDTLKFILEDIEHEVIIPTGSGYTLDNIVSFINAKAPNSSEIINTNGIRNFRISSPTKLKILASNSLRTFGLTPDYEDTNAADTYVTVYNFFRTNYTNPTVYYTRKEITTYQETALISESGIGSTSISIENSTLKYTKNKIISVDHIPYTISGSEIINNKINITLSSKLTQTVNKDTLLLLSERPIVFKEDTSFKLEEIPVTDLPIYLYKNEALVPQDSYEVDNVGNLTLKGLTLTEEDFLTIDYTYKRYITNKEISISYSYYKYLQKGDYVSASYTTQNPDQYFFNINYGLFIADDLQKYVESKVQNSASGIPVSSSSTFANSTSGNGSHYTRIHDIEEKDLMAKLWFEFFNTRIWSYEKERELINGYLVGAESGYVTETDVQDAINNPTSRLYPSGYSDVYPKKLPALFGQNQNDNSSDTLGYTGDLLLTYFINEISNTNEMISLLNYLKTVNSTNSILNIPNFYYKKETADYTVGSPPPAPSQETLNLYIEVENPSGTASAKLLQRNITVTFTYVKNTVNLGGSLRKDEYIISASTAASDINLAITQSLPNTLPYSYTDFYFAEYSGNTLILKCSKAGTLKTRQLFITLNNTFLNLTEGTEVSLRSRNPVWVGGYSLYGISPPKVILGSYIDSLSETDSTRNLTLSKHNDLLSLYNNIQQDWKDPFKASFLTNKTYHESCNLFIYDTNSIIDSDSSFNNKKGNPFEYFTALDDLSVLDAEISKLTNRISLLNSRNTELLNRIPVIQNLLNQENLYDVRYSWLDVRINKETGLMQDKKIEEDTELRNSQNSANTKNLINAFSNYGG